MRRPFIPFGIWSSKPGDRPYIHRDHWVADLLSCLVFWALQAAAWAGLVALVGWSAYAAFVMAVLWAAFWAAYAIGNNVQALIWRWARRRGSG